MKNSKSIILMAIVAGLGIAGWLAFGSGDDGRRAVTQSDTSSIAEGAPMVPVQVPDDLSSQAQIGQRGFEAKCAECHGANAAGRNGVAPPLVHRYYEPGHHADAAFLMAAQNGVRAHHWDFGNMPPVDGVTRADVMAITTYVRELQRANGID